jgi:hypothetical protein
MATTLTDCDRSGSEAMIYYNSVDTGDPAYDCDTPVWVPHTGIKGDIELSETESEQEQSLRDPDQLVRQYTEDKIDLEISGEQVDSIQYDGCITFNAMRARAGSRDIMILSGAITEVNVSGWRGRFRNFDRSKSFPNSGSATQKFKLKPAACIDVGCKVRPVLVSAANVITDYDPATWTYA